MMEVLGVILGGGRGTRLDPLTRYRAKPAVPIGCKYRLVDVPISNCLYCGIDRVYILTQFNSRSLNRHVGQAYPPHAFSASFVEILAAQQSLTREDWYQGTADAVRQNLDAFALPHVRDLLILSGDQLYRLDFVEMVQFHRQTEADMTVALHPVARAEAPRFGLVKLDRDSRVVRFEEKPKDARVLDEMASDREALRRFGVGDGARCYLASMGIYAIRAAASEAVLREVAGDDFGRDVFPFAIHHRPVFGYVYGGYWEDIGTIRSFFDANLAMTDTDPAFNFYDPHRPVYTRPRFLPPARVFRAEITNALLADGGQVEGARLVRAMLGVRSVIRKNVVLENVIHMGAEFYDEPAGPAHAVPLGVGDGSIITNAIIDKDTRIGRGVELVNAAGHVHYESDEICVREGIIVVPRRTTLPDGYTF
ncbi:MAG: NTP transferase domain-containing protein [Planctomycetes bacterium]|nr:NTP transferase domain-containing protein [Planctomycetota bacterium]